MQILNISKRKIVEYIVATFFLVLAFILIVFFTPRHSPKYYLSQIAEQEEVRSTTTVTEQEEKEIKKCESVRGSDNCFRDFYTSYTIKNGVEEAFSHLALVQKQFPELLPSCHYISHGIGHGSLRLNKGNVFKSFQIMNNSTYFKNIATCGNGYFHGLIEEYAKDITDKEKLITLLRPICEAKGVNSNCYHGVGHAAVIQTNNNLEDSLYVCDKLSEEPLLQFECHTGVFMEIFEPKMVEVESGIAKFNMCNEMERPYREACYLEQTSLMERYSNEPMNYIKNMSFCRQIKEPLDKMACVKLFAIRAIRIARFEDFKHVCGSTSSKYERVICMSILAHRTAASMGYKTNSNEYKEVSKDICKILNPLESLQCFNIALKEKSKLFYVSEADFNFAPITLKFIWDFIN